MSSPSKKRSRSIGRSDSTKNEQVSNELHQSLHNNGFLSAINSSNVSNTNHNSSTKTNNNILSRPKLFQYIEDNIIGKDYIFQGPWGLRQSMLFFQTIFIQFMLCF
jgi:hypothetical protein